MATSYIVLKRLNQPPARGEDGPEPDAWEEIGLFTGNPDAIVRKLAAEYGGGLYWPIPARTRAINASVVTPEPIIKLSDFGEDTAPEPTAPSSSIAPSASMASGGIAVSLSEGTLDVGLVEPEPAPV